MALREKKARAVRMRQKGMSYSQIKSELKVAKSTLSLWLQHMPLSRKQINQLRGHSEVRIERYREARRQTRETRLAQVRLRAADDIGPLSKRELFIAGLFLYWGEGSKTTPGFLCISNTDPIMLRFAITWLELLGAPKNRMKIKIHLYRDMNVERSLAYWARVLRMPRSRFTKPYVKDSLQSKLSYPQRFPHGTGNVLISHRDIAERVFMSLEHIRGLFADGKSM